MGTVIGAPTVDQLPSPGTPYWVSDTALTALLDARDAALVGTIDARSDITAGHTLFSLYQPDATGGSDVSAKLQDAIDDLPDNGTLWLGDSSKTYRINSKISCGGKTITLAGNGARIVQGANVTVLAYTGSFGTIWDVTSLSVVSYTFGNGVSTPVVRLTAAGHDLVVGDVVKVFSDDLVPAARQASTRLGETHVVLAVETNNIYLSSQFRQVDAASFTTNVRVAKHLPYALNLKGLRFATLSSGIGVWSSPHLDVTASFMSDWSDLVWESSTGPALQATGCFAYRAYSIRYQNLLNQAQLGRYGYGINDRGCEFGVVDGLHASNVRHAWTTNGQSSSTDEDKPWLYGRSAYSVIANSTAIGTTNSPFDTHEESYGITFVNNVVRGVAVGNNSGGAAFQARGKKHRFIGNAVYDCPTAFAVQSSQPGGTDTDQAEFIDNQTEGITVSTFTVTGGGTGDGVRVKGVRIRGGRHQTRRNFLTASDAVIDLRDVQVDIPMASTAGDAVFRLDDVDLTGNNVTVDLTGSTTTTPYMFRLTDATRPGSWSIRMDRLKLVAASLMSAVVRGAASIDTTGKLAVTDFRSDTTVALLSNTSGTDEFIYTFEDTGETNKQGPARNQLITALNTPYASNDFNTGAASSGIVGYVRTGGNTAPPSTVAYLDYEVMLEKGAWQARIFGDTGTGNGIVILSLDGASQGNKDFYAASTGTATGTINFTVARTGKHVVRLSANTKNASSSGYQVQFHALALTRTSN